jgi:hypothetical protein
MKNSFANSLNACEPIESDPVVFKSVQPEYYRPPQLRIIHFLAWMTLTALLLGPDFGLCSNPYGALAQYQEAMNICRVTVDIVLGTLLVGGGVLLIDGVWKKTGVLQPGHWIVAISALEYSATWLIFFLYRRFTGHLLLHPNYTNLSVVWAVILCLIAALYRWRARKMIERGPWKWTLHVLAYRCFFEGLFVFSQWTGVVFFCAWTMVVYFFYIPLVGLLIAATIRDFCRGFRRDWLHWHGAAAFLAMMIFYDIILGVGIRVAHW